MKIINNKKSYLYKCWFIIWERGKCLIWPHQKGTQVVTKLYDSDKTNLFTAVIFC